MRFVNRGDLAAVKLGFEGLPKAQGDVGILGGIAGSGVDGDAVEGDLRLARADQLFDRNGFVGKVAVGKLVHAVIVQAREHGVRHQHGVVDRGDVDAETGEDLGVVFHVLADLHHGRVFKQGLQKGERGGQVKLAFKQGVGGKKVAALAVADRDVGRLPGFGTH